ncbi:MAG TPA: hypothetical protein VF625_10505, partial [Longimicrobium sp.]
MPGQQWSGAAPLPNFAEGHFAHRSTHPRVPRPNGAVGGAGDGGGSPAARGRAGNNQNAQAQNRMAQQPTIQELLEAGVHFGH